MSTNKQPRAQVRRARAASGRGNSRGFKFERVNVTRQEAVSVLILVRIQTGWNSRSELAFRLVTSTV